MRCAKKAKIEETATSTKKNQSIPVATSEKENRIVSQGIEAFTNPKPLLLDAETEIVITDHFQGSDAHTAKNWQLSSTLG